MVKVASTKVTLVPYVRVTKLLIVNARLGLGLRLGNIYSHTWACYYVTPYMRKLPKVH